MVNAISLHNKSKKVLKAAIAHHKNKVQHLPRKKGPSKSNAIDFIKTLVAENNVIEDSVIFRRRFFNALLTTIGESPSEVRACVFHTVLSKLGRIQGKLEDKELTIMYDFKFNKAKQMVIRYRESDSYGEYKVTITISSAGAVYYRYSDAISNTDTTFSINTEDLSGAKLHRLALRSIQPFEYVVRSLRRHMNVFGQTEHNHSIFSGNRFINLPQADREEVDKFVTELLAINKYYPKSRDTVIKHALIGMTVPMKEQDLFHFIVLFMREINVINLSYKRPECAFTFCYDEKEDWVEFRYTDKNNTMALMITCLGTGGYLAVENTKRILSTFLDNAQPTLREILIHIGTNCIKIGGSTLNNTGHLTQ